MSLTSSIIIDTLDMKVDVGQLLYNDLWKRLPAWKSNAGLVNWYGQIKLHTQQYQIRLHYFASKKQATPSAIVTVGSMDGKHRYFRLSIYPQKFTQSEFEEFQVRLAANLPGFEYQKLFHTADVTRIDLAHDSYSHVVDELIPWSSRTRCSGVWLDKKLFTKGALYIGSHNSRLRFRVYNKKKQMQEVEGVKAQWGTWTRIEAVVRKPGCKAAQLADKLKSPFDSLNMASSGIAFGQAADDAWTGFVTLCLAVGSPEAFNQAINKSKRKLYRQRLAKSAVSWWKHSNFQEQLKKAMCQLAPSVQG